MGLVEVQQQSQRHADQHRVFIKDTPNKKLMVNTFLRFTGYILLKWICFYIYQFAGSSVKWNQTTNYEGRILGAFMLLALPILEIIVLIFPFHLAMKQKGWVTILILILTFTLEFLIGWYATNQHLEVWMGVKIILSVLLFYFLYRKQLNIF